MTNLLLFNMIISDLIRVVLCMPPTIVWDVTDTWFLGEFLCKLLQFAQNTSTSVSVFSLVYIAHNRKKMLKNHCFTSIANPKTFKIHLAIIWFLSLVIAFPESLTLRIIKPELHIDTVLFTQCAPKWSQTVESVYITTKTVFQFIAPLIFLTWSYGQITRRTRFLIRFEEEAIVASQNNFIHIHRLCQLKKRHQVSKLMMALSIIYMVSYLPSCVLAIVSFFIEVRDDKVRVSVTLLAHWMCYLNAAVNPVVYCMMCKRFREEMIGLFRKLTSSIKRGRASIGPTILAENDTISVESFVQPLDLLFESETLSCSTERVAFNVRFTDLKHLDLEERTLKNAISI